MKSPLWKIAHKALVDISEERAALVAHTNDRLQAAQNGLEHVVEALGLGPYICTCDYCSDPIFDKEKTSFDPENGGICCEACSPTYADLLADPESFRDAELYPLTVDRAQAIIDKHLADGGALTDKMVS